MEDSHNDEVEKKARLSVEDHRELVLWAADCAERVLKGFSSVAPDDLRPQAAIEAGRAWVRGEISVSDARAAAFAVHAAAREVENASACAAARSAGHAAATVHVAEHARHAAAYAIKAIQAVDGDAVLEVDWQYQNLVSHLRGLMYPEFF